ncbi:MAG TPA: hypothetical protein VFA04_02615 [Bryobacteraceae bacterium]|nr:hypothetical protein [Bryobacteraceae bacterium]
MWRAALISVAIIVLFGIVLPLSKGINFLDPLILSGCLVLSLVIVGPAAASSFSGPQPTDGPAALRRLGVVVLYAWALGDAVLAAGVMTVNLSGHYRHMFMLSGSFLLAALACSAAATIFIGIVSALTARRYSATAARNALRFVFLGIVLFLFAMARFSGPEWLQNMHAWCTVPHLRKFFAFAAIGLAIADAPLAAVLLRGARYSVPQEEDSPT